MNLYLIFCATFVTVILAKNSETEKKKCKGVNVRGTVHEEQVIINGIDRPYQLAYHETNHTSVIYFTYNYGLLNESTFEVGYVEKGEKIPTPIKCVKNGFATAINAKDNVIYFGGSDGIYIQNLSKPGDAKHFLPNHNIWDLFYKDNLYFITYPKRRLYKHTHGNSSTIMKHITEKLYQFAIDGDGDMFITNKTGLFMIKNTTRHRIHIKGPKIFRAIEVDRKGHAYFVGQNEIYMVNKKDHILDEIAKIKNIFGLTFNRDNHMIFSDPHQIVKLLPKVCPA